MYDLGLLLQKMGLISSLAFLSVWADVLHGKDLATDLEIMHIPSKICMTDFSRFNV